MVVTTAIPFTTNDILLKVEVNSTALKCIVVCSYVPCGRSNRVSVSITIEISEGVSLKEKKRWGFLGIIQCLIALPDCQKIHTMPSRTLFSSKRMHIASSLVWTVEWFATCGARLEYVVALAHLTLGIRCRCGITSASNSLKLWFFLEFYYKLYNDWTCVLLSCEFLRYPSTFP